MSQKMTKNRRKKRLSRRELRRRHERRMSILVCAFLMICVGGFAGIGVLNSRSMDRPASYVVPEGQTEILAAPAAETLGSDPQAGGGLPFLQATELPQASEAPQATLVPMPIVTEEPEELEPDPTMEISYVPITITAVGDCTLGGNVPTGTDRRFDSYVEKYGYDYFFQNVRGLFESDDLTIVNLEGPLTTSDDMRSGRSFNFRGDPSYVNILSGSSVEIANVANNHAMDFGESGFGETAEVLTEAGIGVSGFSKVYFTEVKGVRVCSVGFTEWAYSQAQVEKAIQSVRSQCDLLIVSVHWGQEGSHETTGTQKKLGRAMVDAGADVVIGHHSHVYGGIEQYNGKYIVYSLGNFCFGGNKNPRDKNCTIFQQTFNVALDGTVTDGGINLIPSKVSTKSNTNDYQPYMLSGDEALKQLGRIAKVSNVDAAKMLWMDSAIGQDPARTLDGSVS